MTLLFLRFRHLALRALLLLGLAALAPTAQAGAFAVFIGKAFSPTSVVVGGTSTLTVSLINNTNVTQADQSFNDPFPAGLSGSPLQPVTTGGAGCTFTSTFSGVNNFSASGVSVPANTTCTFAVTVTANTVGPKPNTATLTRPGGLPPDNAQATLDVTPVAAAAVTGIPTLSEWALIGMAGMVALVAMQSMRRRRPPSA